MIRKLLLSDVPRCIEICNQNFKEYSYDVGKDLSAQFADSPFQPEYYVFEENGIIIGLGGLHVTWFDDSIYGLCTCYVLPERQGQGIGKALTEFRIHRIKELGGEIVFSTTQKKRHLERFGFKEIDSPYKDWHLMQLIIT